MLLGAKTPGLMHTVLVVVRAQVLRTAWGPCLVVQHQTRAWVSSLRDPFLLLPAMRLKRAEVCLAVPGGMFPGPCGVRRALHAAASGCGWAALLFDHQWHIRAVEAASWPIVTVTYDTWEALRVSTVRGCRGDCRACLPACLPCGRACPASCLFVPVQAPLATR